MWTTILSFLPGAVGNFIAGKIKGILIGIGLVVLASLIGSVFLYVRGAEKAKAQVIELEKDLAEMTESARKNGDAFEVCWDANQRNAALAARQIERAREAEMRMLQASVNADRDVEDTAHEEQVFRSTGLECPAITADFRQWVRGNP